MKTLLRSQASILAFASLSILPAYAAYGLPQGGARESDANVVAEVRTQLEQQRAVSLPSMINVWASGSVVYLSGEAANEAERRAAEAIALQVAGTRRVVSTIFSEN